MSRDLQEGPTAAEIDNGHRYNGPNCGKCGGECLYDDQGNFTGDPAEDDSGEWIEAKGPTAEEIERDAEYYKAHRNTGNIHIPVPFDEYSVEADERRELGAAAISSHGSPVPTIAVFVEGGLIQDICFDGAVRVVVIDFDQENDDPDDDRMGNYTDPDGNVHRVGVGVWENNNEPLTTANDRIAVRAALRAAGEV